MADEICLCIVGLHEECNDPQPHESAGAPFYTCCCWSVEEITPSNSKLPAVLGYKEATEMKDVLSTGRKRAAANYPIEEGMVCEWSGLRFAGGGVIPIIGCRGTQITAEKGQGDKTGNIHHGPDKNVINNEPENIHRICSKCHNRWHTLNDPFYGERPPDGLPFLPIDREMLPHDPETKATPMQQFNWDVWWATDKKDRTDIEKVAF